MLCSLKDIDEVERIIGHPSVFHSAKDDTSLSPLDIAVICLRDSSYIVLNPYKDTLFMFKRVNQITYEMHVCIVEGRSRRRGLNKAVEAVRWLFKNTKCKKIISYIPEFHERSLIFAKVCGLKVEGLLADSYLKNGRLFNLVLLGATKRQLENLYSSED